MVYMCGDNSMNDQTYVDIEEMMQVGSSAQVKVIVQVDHLLSSNEPGARRYLIENGGKTQLSDLGDVDMADPQTLIDFVRLSCSQFSASKYLLILWDHGNGWPIGYYNVNKDKAIIYDQSSNNWIGIADGELRYAVTEIKKILGKKISILGFDACLMGMAEVASEVSDASEIMFASEEVTPWNGFPYDDLLQALQSNPRISARDYSMVMAQLCANSYNNGSQGNYSCTYSSIDLKRYSQSQENFLKTCNILSKYTNTLLIQQARNSVQTFSIENNPPRPSDDYIDFIDLLKNIKNFVTVPDDKDKIEKSINAFQNSVIAKYHVGSHLNNAQGIAVWFPDNFIAFKKQVLDYQSLNWQKKTSWLSFLNNYYGLDDMKPTTIEISNSNVSNNNFQLNWEKSIDLAPLRYNLIETKNIQTILTDDGDSLLNWSTNGFSLSSQQFYSSPSSFFSGSGNNLNNKLTINEPIFLPSGGLLSFWSYYATEESYLLSGTIKRDVFYIEISSDGNFYRILDSIYGKKKSWSEHRYILAQSDSLWVRFRYTTDASVAELGIYIDDITISVFSATRLIKSGLTETSFNFFVMPLGKYYYLVTPVDSFGNVGFVSHPQVVLVEDYCQPFSLPSPFSTDCKIYCDFPQSMKPVAYIYTISGELVKQFDNNDFVNDTLYWNGKNVHNQDVGDGLYLIMLTGKNFIRVGKIVKVK